MPTDPATLCDWHVRPGALERLVPPWDAPRVLERSGGIDHDGARVVLRMTGGLRWTAEHSDFEPGRRFRDRQVSGPFALWDHDHRFEPCGHGSVLTDEIRWRLPAGRLADLAASGFVDRALDRMFMWRHRRTAEDLAMHARLGGEPLRVAVSGATGLVGSQLLATLGTAGHQVRRIARRPPGPGELFAEDFVAWNASEQRMDATALEGLDAVVHLAGEGIADGRWNDARKRRILESRVQGTRTLARTLARLSSPPRVLVCASAIGFYGHRGDAELDEGADAGRGFLPDVCRAWEAATAEAEAAGIRVVHLRVGIVLDPRGGALAAMAPAFQAAVGGPLGDGRAWMSWVALDDVTAAILHAIRSPALAGPVNAVAPQAATNEEFTRTLAATLRRPALLRVPATALRVLVGEMADALLLASTRVRPGRLIDSGFVFRHEHLDDALATMLGRLDHAAAAAAIERTLEAAGLRRGCEAPVLWDGAPGSSAPPDRSPHAA